MVHDDDTRRHLENKLKYENKIKYKIDRLNNIDGFDFDGGLECKHIPVKKLLNAKVEINCAKNVYEKEIEHDVHVTSPDRRKQVAVDPMETLSREVGYYRK